MSTRFLSAFAALGLALALPVVSGAALIDLTTAGASGTAAGAIGGTFRVQQVPDQSTGTGVIDPFLRLQADGNDKFESGFNTNLAVQLQAKAGTWTHALLLGNVPKVNISGVDYRQFLLDINQNRGNDNEYLTLNQIQIFMSGVDTNTFSLSAATPTIPPLISFSASQTEVFRLNNAAAGFTQILLNYELNHGSGSGDMFLYVRDSAFTGYAASANVIFYSQFGNDPDSQSTKSDGSANDGIEEWATVGVGGGAGPTPSLAAVPEPGSMIAWALGLACCGIGRMRQRARRTAK